jgi:hypothetical protein
VRLADGDRVNETLKVHDVAVGILEQSVVFTQIPTGGSGIGLSNTPFQIGTATFWKMQSIPLVDQSAETQIVPVSHTWGARVG